MERRKYILLCGSAVAAGMAGCVEDDDTADPNGDDESVDDTEGDESNGEVDDGESDDSDADTTDADATIEDIQISHEPWGVEVGAEVTSDERFDNVLRDEYGEKIDRSGGDFTFFEIPERYVKHGGTIVYEVEIEDTVVDSEEVQFEGYQLDVQELVIEASESFRGEDDEYSLDSAEMSMVNQGDMPLEISGIEVQLGGIEFQPFGRTIGEVHDPGREYTYSGSTITETLRTGTYTATVTVETTLLGAVGSDEAEVVIE